MFHCITAGKHYFNTSPLKLLTTLCDLVPPIDGGSLETALLGVSSHHWTEALVYGSIAGTYIV